MILNFQCGEYLCMRCKGLLLICIHSENALGFEAILIVFVFKSVDGCALYH